MGLRRNDVIAVIIISLFVFFAIIAWIIVATRARFLNYGGIRRVESESDD